MMRLLCSTLMVCALAMAACGAEPEKASESFVQDIEVTVRYMDGKSEVFGKEVAQLDIVVDELGRINMVHMVLISDKEKDTHVWYNYANLAGFKYRFLHITGKGKVQIRQLQGFKVNASDSRSAKSGVGGVEVDSYK